MTLSWSLDKLGPMTRGVEDAMLVLQAISGPDADDVAIRNARIAFSVGAPQQLQLRQRRSRGNRCTVAVRCHRRNAAMERRSGKGNGDHRAG